MKRLLLISALLIIAFLGGLHFRYPQYRTSEALEHVSRSLVLFAQSIFRESANVELANVKRIMLKNNPEFKDLNGLALAVQLRNWASQFFRDETPPGFDFTDLEGTIKAAYDGTTHLCGGVTIVYLIALRAFDFDARYIGFFSNVEGTPRVSHATVEVFIDDHWIALDPSYNISVLLAGKMVGWGAAREAILSGGKIDFHHNGPPTIGCCPHGIPMDHMSAGPSRISAPFFSWGAGVIRYDDGEERKLHFRGVYERLAQH
ncbi:MAG: transglutaminase domain-containing protein [Desulfobacterales bacterium]|nr:transglutaminase domain-containing protein [Desulfobacterales bacterium]